MIPRAYILQNSVTPSLGFGLQPKLLQNEQNSNQLSCWYSIALQYKHVQQHVRMNAFRWPHKNILFFSRSEWVLERLCLDTFLQHSLRLTVDRNDVLLCIILSATLPSSPPSFPPLLYSMLWSWQLSGVWGVWREDNYFPSFPSLNAKHWQSWNEMKAERCSRPPVSRQMSM